MKIPDLLRIRLLLISLAALFVSGPGVAGIPPKAFSFGSFEELLAARNGEPFLLVLWATDCAPCRQEFALLEKVRAANNGLPMALIATDNIQESALIVEMLEMFELNDVESWVFAEQNAQKLRYEIDPGWYGELPRSYFYTADHSRRGISGRLEKAAIQEWLETNVPTHPASMPAEN